MWAQSAGPGQGSTFLFTIVAPDRAAAGDPRQREFVGVQPALAGKRVLIVDDNATNRRVLGLQTAKWGMQSRATESPGEALRWLDAGRCIRSRDPRHAHARDGRPRARDAHSRAQRRAAARPLQFARAARGRRERRPLQRIPRQAGAPVAALRHAGRLAGEGRKRQAGRTVDRQTEHRSADGRAPPVAHPARRGQRREPEARAAHPAADGLPRGPGQQRPRGGRVGRAASLRRRADGRADARDGRTRGHARHLRALAARAAAAHRRDDGERHARRPRTVPRGRHGRLSHQADPRRPPDRSARGVAHVRQDR